MRHIIYIPGFGDRFDGLRQLTLRRWRHSDTRVSFVPMHWNDKGETYQAKYERVAAYITDAHGDEVTLVGESAGGAMAMLAFARNLQHVDRVVTICGYNHGVADVHRYHQRAHPAFYQLMPVVDEAVASFASADTSRITTIYSAYDRIVTAEHSRIAGAHERILHTPGHFISIVRSLLRNPTR